MKTKTTFKNLSTVVIVLLLLTGFNAKAQTHFFQDVVANGTVWHAAASEISNPKSDAVNSSSICIQNTGVGGWQDTQLNGVSYTIKSGDKIYVSFYNPNGAAAWQLKMNLNGSDTWIGEPAHASGAATGWNEVSVDLTTYVGQALTQIKIYPAAGESKAINFDNIYIHTSSVLGASGPTNFFQDAVANGTIWHAAASEISNPKSDAVNSSSICIQNTGVGGWQDTQINGVSYTIKSGDKIYVSFYNPNGAAAWQLKMNLNGSDTWIGEPAHASGAASGWNEVSVDLATYVGQALTQIKIYPAAGESKAINFDNIYIHTSSVLGAPASTSYVYNESTASGIYFWPAGSEVSNPVSDAVNSSTNCASSGTSQSWSQIQYFPTYAPLSGDKLYFSIYNPDNVGPGQLQFEYTSGGGWQWGGNLTYDSGSVSGWKEYSVDLASHVGNTINKIILMPAGGSSSAVYIDNIYFATSSTLSTNSVAKIDNRAYVSKEGKIQFAKEQTNTLLSVFDLSGRLILEEKVNGVQGTKTLNNKGIYILRVKSDQGVGAQKIIF